ncbi:MAG: glutamate dehydrogenase, partial [Frankiaceae bacterium]|nr:glutamate dehydrogenase [Frankiaceae bacterium]
MAPREGQVRVEGVDETLIDVVCERLRDHLPVDDAEQAARFVRQYYRWVAPDDVADRTELDVYGAGLAHFNFARDRAPGMPKVRVYNPDFETHGWKSTHTAVEVVTDDMPFLVDSVTMELNRRGFGVHVIIHPVITMRRDAGGRLVEVLTQGDAPVAGQTVESVLHAEVDRETDDEALAQLADHVRRVIGEVRAAVEDWEPMRGMALQVASELGAIPPPI